MNIKKTIISSLIGLGVFLSGCAQLDHRYEIERIADNTEQTASKEIKNLLNRNDINSPYVRKVKRPFIASKSKTLSYDAALPKVFTKVVLRLPYKRYNLAEIADIIQTETGISVLIAEDTFLNPKDLLKSNSQGYQNEFTDQKEVKNEQKRLTKNVPNGIMPLSALDAPQGRVEGEYSGALDLPLSNVNYSTEMEIDHRGSLASLLDKVTSRMGITWEYNGQEIKIQRFITRTFNIKTHTVKLNEITEIGNVSNNSSDDGTAYKTNIGLKTETKQDPFNDLLNQIKSMLTKQGQAIPNEGSMTITVTDTKNVIEKVQGLINEHNAIMGRQIRLQVQLLKFTSKDNKDRSLELNLIYQNLKNAGAIVRDIVNVNSPSSLVSGATAGLMGVSVTDPTSRWNGSAAIMRVLDNLGKTSEQMNRVLVTMNNKPAPISVTRQFSYIAETTPGTIASTGTTVSSSVGITQKTDTVGFTMFITPFVTDANNIALKLALNKRVLVRIDTAESGSGDTKQQVQQPIIDGEIHQEYATVKAGETLLISGYEIDTNSFDSRNGEVSWTALMGGSYTGQKSRELTILLVTPYLVDGE